MRCVTKHEPYKANYLFFLSSLIDVFQPTNETLWAFSVWHGTDILYEYLNQPFYQYPEQALKAAKLHVLTNLCERSRQLRCLTFHSTDRVFVQSEGSINSFGVAKDMAAKDFYLNPQQRIDVLRELRIHGEYAEHKNHLTDLDGRKLEGVGTLQRIELDCHTSLLLELFKPADTCD